MNQSDITNLIEFAKVKYLLTEKEVKYFKEFGFVRRPDYDIRIENGNVIKSIPVS